MVFVLISIGGATNSPQRRFPGVGYLVQHVLHARGLRGALDIAFRLQAVVALVSEISGDGAGFFLQTSEEGDFVVREDIRHRGPPYPGRRKRIRPLPFDLISSWRRSRRSTPHRDHEIRPAMWPG
jgi:hypothetical protein